LGSALLGEHWSASASAALVPAEVGLEPGAEEARADPLVRAPLDCDDPSAASRRASPTSPR
jgi:hypothetical protein